jgi:hypothetical protein
MTKKFTISAVAAAVIILAGCAGGGSTGMHQSGFLSDYSRLSAVEGTSGTYRYIDRNANLRPYTKVLIDPVQVILAPGVDASQVNTDTMKRVAEATRMEFVGALLSGYQVVNQPGPDVLRVRLAITGIQPVKPELGATDFIPIKAIYNVARDASGNAQQVAEISAEAEVLDPAGRVVGQAVSTRKSDKTLPQGEKITWKDLQVIVAVWGKNFRQNLDMLRGYAAK